MDRSLEATGTCGDCGLNKKDFNDLEDQGKRVICDPLCSQDGADHRGCGWEGRFIECRECSMWGDWNWDNSYPCGASNTCAQPYQQCGGDGWTGPACCPPNHFCTEDQYDPGYLQCLPNDKKTQAPVTATPTTPAPSALSITQEPTAAVTAPPTPEPTQAAPETVAPTAAPTVAPTAPPLATPKPTHKKKTKKPTAQPIPTPIAPPTTPPTAAVTTLRPTAAPGACDKVNSACTLLAAAAAAAAGSDALLPPLLPSTCCGGLECVVEVTGGAAGRCADPATAAAVSLLVTARAHPGNDCALAAAQAVVGAQTSGLCGDDCAVLSATVAACQRAAEARRGRRLSAAADAPQQWRRQRGGGAARELAAVCATDAAASCDVSIELSMVHLGGFEGAQAGVAALLAPPGLRAIAESMGVPPAQVTVSNIAVQGAAQQVAGAPPVGGGIDGGGSGSAQPPPADTAAQPGAGSYWVISVIAVVLAAVWIVGLCVLWRVLRARRAARRALADKVAHFKELEATGGYVKEGGGGGGDGEAYHFKLTSSVKTMLGKAFEESQADDEFSYAVSTRSGRSKQSTSRSSRAPSAAPSGALSHARTRASLYASSYVSSSRGSPRSTTEDEDESSRSSGGGGGGGADALSVDMSLSTYDTRDTRFHRMRALTPTSRAASISEVSGGGYGGDGGSSSGSSSSSDGSPQRSAAAPLRSHPPTPAATAPQPRGDAARLKLFLFNSVATADSAISALTEKTGTFGSISGGGGGGDGASVYFTDADAGAGSAAGDGSVSLCTRSVLSDGDGPLPINAVSPISRHM